MKTIYHCILILIFFSSLGIYANSTRIVSLSASTTEIISSLGGESLLVGVDLSSNFPKEVSSLPKVGYMRTLSIEGILSLKPQIVIGTEEAGPKSTLEQLQKANVKLLILDEKYNFESVVNKINQIGKFIGKEKEAKILSNSVLNEYKSLPFRKSNIKVLFLYSRNANSIFISGKNTAAHHMIELSGAKNAITDFSDYKQLTPESLAIANPDFILMPEGSVKGLGGESSIWELPGMNLTRAGKEKNLIIMDDLMLLGFGPRFPKAIAILNQKWNSL